MAKKVTQTEVVKWFEELYAKGAIYVWGANGDTITKTLMDKLYACYGSSTYNKDYYNSKLAEGKGKIGADCSGALYKLSGVDRTAKGYYGACTNKGLIASMPKNKVCLVFNKNLTHVGCYLGNGTTIEMRSSKLNVYKESFKSSRWYYFGLADFIDYEAGSAEIEKEVSASNVIITNYQKWVNGILTGSDIQEDGVWGPKTKVQTVRLLQHIFNKYYGANIKEDGEYGPKTKAACPSWAKMKANTEAFTMITYIIHVYLYAVCKYSMTNIINTTKVSTTYNENTKAYVSDYQNSTRGLKVDGYAGPATLYQMFK